MANTKAKKTNKKKSSPAKKKSAKKKNNLPYFERHKYSIMLSYLITSILLMCVAFIPGVNLWAKFKGIFFAFFGVGFYFFIIALFVIGIRIALGNMKKGTILTTVSAFIVTMSISSFVHLCVNTIDGSFGEQFFNATSLGWNIGIDGINATGGIIGSLLGGGLLHTCGKAASFAIMAVITIVFLVLFLNLPMKNVGNTVANVIVDSKTKIDSGSENIKQKRNGRREIRRQQREEERLLREQQEKDRAEEIENNDNVEIDPEQLRINNIRRTPKPYTPRDRIFTFVEPTDRPESDAKIKDETKAVIEPEDDIEIIPDNEEEFEEIVEDIKKDEPEALVKNHEEVEDFLSPDAHVIVENAIKTANKSLEKNKAEVYSYKDETVKTKKEYVLPPIECLNEPKFNVSEDYANEMKTTSKKLVDTLRSFGVETKLIGISRGPAVTRYELSPAPGVKISKITNLSDDIALNLASSGVRIEAPIPNKSAVGIEVPNKNRSMVTLREMISSKEFKGSSSKLNVALGKDITGNVNCADLAKMPHLLIAGTTGSGKSVCLNCMIVSILYNATPQQVKLLMIDPKQVEFSVYNGIPHLLVPVISDVRKAAGSLAWAVGEMENRYKTFSTCGVRDIKGYNKYILNHPELEPMAQIVIFIDELNDLMMISPKEVEDSICRLAQKARAAGMHLVVATQRPSVDVITGIIKANIPSRISLSVSSQVDSRTILDTIGAEKLLGNGDMLYNPVGVSKPVRIQGAYLSDSEIERIVDFIKGEEEAEYDNGIMDEIEKNAVADKKKNSLASAGDEVDGGDEMLNSAIDVIVECQAASTTLLQRKLRLGYARAARIMDELEQKGYVGPADGSKPRKVLITQLQLMEMKATKDSAVNDNYDILSD